MFRSIKKSITIGEIITIIAVLGSFIISYYSNKNAKEIALLQSREQYNIEMIKHKEEVIRDASELIGFKDSSYANELGFRIQLENIKEQNDIYARLKRHSIETVTHNNEKIIELLKERISIQKEHEKYSAKIYASITLSKLYFGPKTSQAADKLMYQYRSESNVSDMVLLNYIAAMRDEESYGLKDTSKLDKF